ncbi:hypothetical protein [Roseateles sp.]|uniref:hypothetical protein n=1 Tax=Roseateles sp. TaxID=1971397 RepID=UPI0031DED417
MLLRHIRAHRAQILEGGFLSFCLRYGSPFACLIAGVVLGPILFSAHGISILRIAMIVAVAVLSGLIWSGMTWHQLRREGPIPMADGTASTVD